MSDEEVEAIENKIKNAGCQIPHVTNAAGWNILFTTGVLTGPEIVLITNFMSLPPQPPARSSVLSPYAEFLKLLPDAHKPVNPETASIIERYYGKWLRGIFSVKGAVTLLETATRHVHRSTTYRIRVNAGILLCGVFQQADSESSDIVRAFDIYTLSPKVAKFGPEAPVEYEIYLRMGFESPEEALAMHLVPLRFIIDTKGKQAIVMPAFLGSLSSVRVNRLPDDDPCSLQVLERTMLKGLGQIATALSYLHRVSIVHNDIKPGNILLNMNGDWFLCDYDSATHPDVTRRGGIKYTSLYIPSDLRKGISPIAHNTPAFDKLLLVVTVLDRLEILKLNGGFYLRDVYEAIDERVLTSEMKVALLDLLPGRSDKETSRHRPSVRISAARMQSMAFPVKPHKSTADLCNDDDPAHLLMMKNNSDEGRIMHPQKTASLGPTRFSARYASAACPALPTATRALQIPRDPTPARLGLASRPNYDEEQGPMTRAPTALHHPRHLSITPYSLHPPPSTLHLPPSTFHLPT
eukprot:gene24759-29918_t